MLGADESYFAYFDADNLADIMLGRWPVKVGKTQDLVTIAQKTIGYEQDPDIGEWRRDGLLIAGYDAGFDFYLEQAKPYFSDIGYDTITVRQSTISPELFRDTVTDCLNQGEIITFYADHGSPCGWCNFDTTDLKKLVNRTRLPVVLSAACLTGAFQWDHPFYENHPRWPRSDSCFGELFLVNPDGGAIAFWGATRYVGMPNYQTLLMQLFRYQHWILGVWLFSASNRHYCLLGDPALDLGDYTAFPDLPDLVIRPQGIDISCVPPYPTGGDSILIRAKVLNIGRATAEDVVVSVVVQLGPEGIFNDTVIIEEIGPRDSAVVTTYWPTNITHPNYYGEIGMCDFVVTADPDSAITESWEHNNSSKKTARVTLYPNEPGWPKKVVGFSQPALADLDNEDLVDVIYAGHDSIYVFEPDGSILNGWPQYFHNVYAVAIADLDCVDNMEIVAVSPESVTVYDDGGHTVSGWPRGLHDTTKCFYGFPAIGCISGSKERQVAVYVGGREPDNGIQSQPTQSGIMVYDYDGDSLYYLTHEQMVLTRHPKSNGASISDVNGDDKSEIMVSYYQFRTDSSYTAIFNRDGHVQTLGWGSCQATSALADLNDDGTDDIITGCADASIRAYDALGDMLLWARQTEGPINSSPAVGDIHPTEDGVEITFGNDASWIHLREKDAGDVLDPWPYHIVPERQVGISPAIANIDGDTCLDVIVGANDNCIYAFTHTMATITPYPLPLVGSPTSPAIGDIEGDEASEVITVSSDGYLHAWENRASQVVVYNLEWPQFHHDYQRTGLYNWVSGMRGGDANPKEFSTATTISFSLSDSLHTRIRVYDADGDIVKNLVNQTLPVGTYNPVWHGNNNNYSLLPNGLYFIEIRVKNESKIITVEINR